MMNNIVVSLMKSCDDALHASRQDIARPHSFMLLKRRLSPTATSSISFCVFAARLRLFSVKPRHVCNSSSKRLLPASKREFLTSVY